MRVEPGHRQAGQHARGGSSRRAPPSAVSAAGRNARRGGEQRRSRAGTRRRARPTTVSAAGQAATTAPTPATPERDQHARRRRRRSPTTASTACAADALAQHEGVLRADGDDEREAGAESGGRGESGSAHAVDARNATSISTAKDSYVSLACFVMTDLPLDQVRTLLAVVDEGTFDAAAAALHVTPSAVSQRVKALEQRTGRVLLLRTKPVRLTESGEVVVRFARQLARLGAGRARRAGPGGRRRAGAGADRGERRLAGDLVPARARPGAARSCGSASSCAARTRTTPPTLLREGVVMAAVTSSPDAVQGCSVRRLGRMRYLPVASPAFVERRLLGWPARRCGSGCRTAPVVVFDRRDDLQDAVRPRADPAAAAPAPLRHYVPVVGGFADAVDGRAWAGGWCPSAQAEPRLRAGALVALAPERGRSTCRCTGSSGSSTPRRWPPRPRRWRRRPPRRSTRGGTCARGDGPGGRGQGTQWRALWRIEPDEASDDRDRRRARRADRRRVARAARAGPAAGARRAADPRVGVPRARALRRPRAATAR